MFHWADYLLFSLSLGLTLFIAIGLAFKEKWLTQTSESYLMADRNIHWFMVAMSLLVSSVNAVFAVGVTTEFYYFGMMFTWFVFSLIAGPILVAIFTVTKYSLLRFQVTSAYEYFQHRFDYSVRIFCSCLYVFLILLYLAVLLYVPCLVISQVAGFDIKVCISIAGIICMIYTGLGGMKGVIWVDNIQAVIILAGLVILATKGVISVGGLSEAWKKYEFGKRAVWDDMDASPWNRHGFWGLMFFGPIFLFAHTSSHQEAMQRCFMIPNLRDAQRAVIMNGLVLAVMYFLILITAIAAFATLGGNDPILTGLMTRPDAILGIFIMEVLGDTPGVPGLLVASLFALALSSLSSGQNSTAALVLEDMVKPFWRWKTGRNLSIKTASIVCKIAGFMAGLITLALSLTVIYFDDYIFSLARSVESFLIGPITGVLVCALFVKYVESKGVLVGAICSLLWTIQQYIGNLKMGTKIGYDQPPLYMNNFTLEITIPVPTGQPNMYDLTYISYSFFAALVVVIVASIVSPIVHLVKFKGCPKWTDICPPKEFCYTMDDFRIAIGINSPPNLDELCPEKEMMLMKPNKPVIATVI